MKKPHISILVVITFVFAAFTAGFYFGKNQSRGEIQVSIANPVAVVMQTVPSSAPEAETAHTVQTTVPPVVYPLDINTATYDMLITLPGIGEVIAQRIIDYREQNGPFTATAELTKVEGIGPKRLEEILELVTVQ